MRNILIFLGILSILAPIRGFAEDEDVEQAAVSDGEQCVQKCNDFYKQKKHLRGFSYYKGIDLTKTLEFPQLEEAIYCRAAANSLNKCYAKESSLYNTCKWVSKKTVETILTSNQTIVDMFASCKDTCLTDLKKICPNI